MEYRDRDFTGEQVTIDDNLYSGCVFNGCTVRFFGVGEVNLFANSFNNCIWEFSGPAGSALKMLRALYNSGDGAKELIEATLATIRTPLDHEGT